MPSPITSDDHPLRQPLSDLMHEREIPVTRAPVTLRSWVYLVPPSARAAETAWVNALDADGSGAAERWRLVTTDEAGGAMWERHGEFSTWLKFSHNTPKAYGRSSLGFDAIAAADFAWLEGAAGEVFRSVEIAVLPHAPKPEHLNQFIGLQQAVCCDVFGGAARIWSDFRLHPKPGEPGAGRIYVQDKGLKNDELSRLLQTLLEIGNYRKLALLGFPVARALFAWLPDAEARLARVTADMAGDQPSRADILDQLLALSAEVETRVNEVRFRQGATEAYYRLTMDRLSALREQRVEGFSTMQEFIERRLTPAMRTCEAAFKRLDDLSTRIARASDLLRAKISIGLDLQNQDLLKSMNLRSALQIKMQGLVEGLSVFAVSYYIFHLVKYLLEPVVGHGPQAAWLNAGIILVILTLAWGFIYHKKKAISHDDL
ncbi:DUF3422 domain-containing protein [Asticcacaulis endophyticus]|uniref:DUF3422 domain-containing protein n=1 Tax=Asticcacaulis endophyticus TaxID=1395890 RepID=A0A918QHC6_9CAUL|nr:DUF3422 domain-containing protein [Asticcacaulis endophyticus]GGZ44447.1 hypothetical protein GCM10011273_33990 [Asticcacaulis endophyticus]